MGLRSIIRHLFRSPPTAQAQARIARLEQRLKEKKAELRKAHRAAWLEVRTAYCDGLVEGIASGLTPDDVVCDLGANMGKVTEVLARSGATVHAFDPDPYCVEQLRKRFADSPNVVIHPVAAGASAGTVELRRARGFEEDPEAFSVSSTTTPGGWRSDPDPEKVMSVPMIAFQDFAADLLTRHARIAFVKMDIEGAELDLLPAMDAAGLLGRIGLTVAELHPVQYEYLRPRFEALREDLSAKYPKTRLNLDWI